MMVRVNRWPAVALALVWSGCTPDDQRMDSVDMERIRQRRDAFPEAGLLQLDSGNTAYRAEEFEAAIAHYRSATDIMPDNAASWFGVAMAGRPLGLPAVVDSAMARAQDLAPGASLIHDPDSTGGAQ